MVANKIMASVQLIFCGLFVASVHSEMGMSNKVTFFHHDVKLRMKRASGGLSQTDINTQVTKHNSLRIGEQAADMKYMKWNSVLATMAQTWAEACDYEHGQPAWPPNTNLYSSLGQNLLFTTGSLDHNSAVQSWFNEKSNYNYDSGACSGVCGHYTQVVWSSSYELGCGAHLCSTLRESSTGKSWSNANYLVCNYGPPGNLQGAKPYLKGDPCSKCASGSMWCFNDTCRDCPAEGITCECKSKCQNCATSVASNCSCACAEGWMGVDCSTPCQDTNVNCNKNPGWPPFTCTSQEIVRSGCPAMCGICQKATASTPKCESKDETTTSITTYAPSTEAGATTAANTANTSSTEGETTTSASDDNGASDRGGKEQVRAIILFVLLVWWLS